VDLPTGIEADTGQCDPAVLTADETITFAALKPAHVTYPGAAHVGKVTVVPLGWPEAALQHTTTLRSRVVLEQPDAAQRLPRRALDANKGTFGKALVVAGSGNYIGATLLAAESAYRVGAGLVTVATPAPNVRLLAPQLLEATWLPLTHHRGSIDESAADIVWDQFGAYTAILIGPGLGQAQATASFIDVLFPLDEALPPLPTTYPDPPFPSFETLLAQKTQQPPPEVVPPTTPPPLVIDADALNLLAQLPFWWKRLPPRTILTPHAGEMARLAGITATVAGRSPAQQVQADRLRLVEAKAAEWNCIVVLKGANTIVADPHHTEVIPFATPALARAGTGDALAGCIVGYLAQGLDPAVAAALGVYVHGQAGLFAAERVGTTASVLASDVIAALPRSIRALEQLASMP
jgi:NAD(P)H-hydrate epimerase